MAIGEICSREVAFVGRNESCAQAAAPGAERGAAAL